MTTIFLGGIGSLVHELQDRLPGPVELHAVVMPVVSWPSELNYFGTHLLMPLHL
jgi:hypothetical protein